MTTMIFFFIFVAVLGLSLARVGSAKGAGNEEPQLLARVDHIYGRLMYLVCIALYIGSTVHLINILTEFHINDDRIVSALISIMYGLGGGLVIFASLPFAQSWFGFKQLRSVIMVTFCIAFVHIVAHVIIYSMVGSFE